jgi:hypothetical protein
MIQSYFAYGCCRGKGFRNYAAIRHQRISEFLNQVKTDARVQQHGTPELYVRC